LTSPSRSLGILLAVAGLLGAGCGGGRLSKQDYVDEVRAIESSDTAREATVVYDKMAAFRLPQGECAEKARTLHGDLEEIVDRVDGLSPPADVQRLQNRFVSAGRNTVDVIGALADQIEAGTLACGQPFNRRAYGLPSTKRAEDVIEELGRRGYKFGLNSE
jgi:hypothetical protein